MKAISRSISNYILYLPCKASCISNIFHKSTKYNRENEGPIGFMDATGRTSIGSQSLIYLQCSNVSGNFDSFFQSLIFCSSKLIFAIMSSHDLAIGYSGCPDRTVISIFFILFAMFPHFKSNLDFLCFELFARLQRSGRGWEDGSN